jgi:hypothetical protein
MATFVEKQYYDFDYAGLEEEDNGDVYIYLKYNGESSIPGFPRFAFRVKAYPFQIVMPPDRFPQKIRCLVKGLIAHSFDPDHNDPFPVLTQDRAWLLPQAYVPGFTYDFTVIGQDSAGNYNLKDIGSGIEHYRYRADAALQLSDKLSLVVKNINKNSLELVTNRYDAIVGAKFKVGQKHDFTIRKIKPDEQQRQYLQLIDQTRGFWHRFYLEKDDTPPDQDSVSLEIGDITPEGWLCLQYPGTRLTDIQKVRQAEHTDFGREDERREFKSSIAFPPRNSTEPAARKNQADFGRQLRGTIMRTIASFVNSAGGDLLIGVNDDGEVRGIENDLPLLNADEQDQYNGQYAPSTDGYEQKIRNAIGSTLGNFANSLVSIHFYKVEDPSASSNELVFCKVEVKSASTPVFYGGTRLFVRAGNSTRLLLNGDITSFVLERMRNQQQLHPQPVNAPAVASAALPEAPSLTEITGNVSLAPAPKRKLVNWGVLSFLPDGGRQFGRAVTEPAPVAALRLSQEHRKTKYQLLQCYASGSVNAVGNIRTKVPAQKNLPYKNGWNSDDKLLQVFVCCPDDYLVLRSEGRDGNAYVKAIQVKEITLHDSLTAQGNGLLDQNRATLSSYQLVPERLNSFIYDIISKKRNNDPGYSTGLLRVQDCIEFLDQQKAAPKSSAS